MKIAFFGGMVKSNCSIMKEILTMLAKIGQVYYFGFDEYSKDILEENIIICEPISYDEYDKIIESIYQNNYVKEARNIFEFVENEKYQFINYIKIFKKLSEKHIDKVKEINPDYIVRDYDALNGYFIGKELGKKIIGISPMIYLDENFILENQVDNLSFYLEKDIGKIKECYKYDIYNILNNNIKEVCREYNIPEMNLLYICNNYDDITICFGGKSLNQIRNENKDVIMARPHLTIMKEGINSNDVQLENMLKSEKKLIYVGSGSIINGDNNYYTNIIKALWDYDANIIISIPDLESYNSNIPEKFLIRSFVPQQEILKKASLFITFGGYNSICEAIEYEVPMIIYPQMNDQFINAHILKKVNIGNDLRDYKLDYEGIRKAIDETIDNVSIKYNLKKLKSEFSTLENIETILNKIIR